MAVARSSSMDQLFIWLRFLIARAFSFGIGHADCGMGQQGS